MKRQSVLPVLLVSLASVPISLLAQSQQAKLEQEPACQTLKPASAGGPMPQSPEVMVLRYLGYASYEVAFRDKILLLDAYYDNSRPSGTRTVGLKASEVIRADAIFVGHPHGDHYQDAPEVSKRTGATIFVGRPGRAFLEKEGVPADRIKYVRGGETFAMPGYTVQTALAIHAEWDPEMLARSVELTAATADPPLSADEQKQIAATAQTRGALAPGRPPGDPETDVINYGTIAYVLTFDNGFRLAFRDSPGRIGEGERELTNSILGKGGKIDVAIIAWTRGPSPRVGLKYTLPLIELYHPRIYLPAHQDEVGNPRTGLWPEAPTFPLFLMLREQLPDVKGLAPLYRSPVCINTKTDEFYHGEWVR